MRREMITVPAWLAFAGLALHWAHPWVAAGALIVAGFDTLTGRS